MKSYNLGIYHASPYENYYVTKAALFHLRNNPKLVILGTNPVMFERPVSQGRYTPLILGQNFSLIFYRIGLILNSQEGINQSTFLKSVQEKYLFTHVLNTRILGKTYQPTREIRSVYNGHLEFYNQLPSQWSGFERIVRDSSINEKQVQYFEQTIKLLLSKNIEVLVVNPPIWFLELDAIRESQSFLMFEETIDHFKEHYVLVVYNESHDFLRNQLEIEDFLNTQHLNYKGSVKFTDQLCKYLLERDEQTLK